MLPLAKRSSHSQCRHTSFTPKGKVFHFRVNLQQILTGKSQLWTSNRSPAPQHSASRGNYQVWVQICRLLQWLHGLAVPTVSLLSHICGAVTFTCSQSPLQLISPQETASQIGQWKKMGAGTERGAHSLGHQHTVRIHSAAVNPKSHPPSVSIAPGDIRTVRVLHSTEQSHPCTPSLLGVQGICVEPLHISSPSRQATEGSQHMKCSGSAQSTTSDLQHRLCAGLFHRLLPLYPTGTLGHTCSTSSLVSIHFTVQSLAVTSTSL